jgi:hypothetical protein
MEGFSFVTPVTGLNRPNTGKKDDDGDDDDEYNKAHAEIPLEVRNITGSKVNVVKTNT